MERRKLLKNLALAGLVPALPIQAVSFWESKVQSFRHSVCRWCYKDLSLEALADIAIDVGIHSIELLNPDEWDVVLKKGLKVALSNGSSLGITKGWNTPKYHGLLQKDFLELIPKVADQGITQIIVFSGNRNGMSDEEGLENCAVGLDPIIKYAAQHQINLVMELLNSKLNHPDYQCDHTAWGVKLIEKIGAPNFKLLYDIYHMQVMEGDIIQTIRDNHQYIGHYHTAGVPGRHEIDASQELNYKAIIKAIAETGFTGYVAQEFIPAGSDASKALKQAIEICSV